MAAKNPDDPITNDLMVGPRPEEAKALGEAARLLDGSEDVRLICDDGEPVSLPESLREGLSRLATFLAGGASVAIEPYDQILTTQQAADLLGISRPYLIQLIEERHAIPCEPRHDPGRHRRLRLSDVLAYRDGRTFRAVITGHQELRDRTKMKAKEVPLSR
jgi:excisionase family DNA binding protein